MNAEYAIASLQFTQIKLLELFLKVIASAVANAGLDPVDAVITSARVDKGPVLKDLLQEQEVQLHQSINQLHIL